MTRDAPSRLPMLRNLRRVESPRAGRASQGHESVLRLAVRVVRGRHGRARSGIVPGYGADPRLPRSVVRLRLANFSRPLTGWRAGRPPGCGAAVLMLVTARR